MPNPLHATADYLIGLWLDQMTLAGFTAARWWAGVAMGAPMGKGD